LQKKGIEILNAPICRNMQRLFCNCALQEQNYIELSSYVSNYHFGLERLISTGRYDSRDDFTVVLQPFMKFTKPPTLVSYNRWTWAWAQDL
jgi:phospholipase B1, membrane-associated